MSLTRPADNRPWNSRPFFSRPAREDASAHSVTLAGGDELFAFGGDSDSGARGYSSQGDVLVSQTSDGVDLNRLWDDAAAAMSKWNQKRSSLAALVSYPTVNAADAIPQVLGGDHFEVASEFGEPTGLRAEPNATISRPSVKAKKLASSPVINSSRTTAAPATPKPPPTISSLAACASARFSAIMTPLPAANPSALMT